MISFTCEYIDDVTFVNVFPGGEMCWCGVNFPRDLKCQILSSRTVEIAFKRRKQANM